MPPTDQCQTGSDSRPETLLDTMLREDTGEELNSDSNENYFYRFLWAMKNVFYFLIFNFFVILDELIYIIFIKGFWGLFFVLLKLIKIES